MLIAQVMRTGWDGPRRYAFPGEHAALIKGAGTDVRLVEHGEGPVIAYLWRSGRRVHLDLRGATTTYVNGERIEEPRALEPEDEVRVGLFRYRFSFGALPTMIDRTPYAASDPTEQQLIAELAHPATRGVYADWLEERGDLTRAALLRVQVALAEAAGEDAEALRARLAALATLVPAGWRTLVANPAIEACDVRFRFQCPKQWADLVPTERDGVRHCRTCDREVHYAISVGEARGHARRGHCVALDVTSARWRDDLAPPYNARCEACGADRSPKGPKRGCDHCGLIESHEMLMGDLA